MKDFFYEYFKWKYFQLKYFHIGHMRNRYDLSALKLIKSVMLVMLEYCKWKYFQLNYFHGNENIGNVRTYLGNIEKIGNV